MDVLREFGVHIDLFPKNDHRSEDTTYLLTHIHKDHIQIPKTFCGTIVTTSPTELVNLFLPNVCCTIQMISIGGTYSTLTHLRYTVFSTEHAPYSCGFFFPTLQLLYLGDGRVSTITLMNIRELKPRHIMYDGLFENVDLCGREDTTILKDTLHTVKAIYCVHYGILWYIKKFVPNILFRCDENSLNPLLLRTLKLLNLYDSTSKYILLGPTCNLHIPHILPSALWFIVNKKNIQKTYTFGFVTRVFASCHSTPSHINKLRSISSHTLEPIKTRPLFTKKQG